MDLSNRIEKLNFVERWFRDGLKAVDPPGGLLTLDADMSVIISRKAALSKSGISISYTHFIVVAVAAALGKHPELHKLTAGNKRLWPQTVDICLSISSENAVTPVLILKDANSRSLEEIANEIRDRTPVARENDRKLVDALRKWGWIVPFAFLRRALIGFLLNRLWYRRMVSGTFQVTVVPGVDMAVPFLFNTAAALGAGRVRDRVVAVNGKVEVRPTITLACCCDHKVWNGMDTATFLNAVKQELEQDLLQPLEG